MANLTKVKSFDTSPFNKTIEHKLLMCSNVTGNNNKFYSIELQTDGSNYQLFSHYGRINGTVITGGVYEIRSGYFSEDSAMKELESIVKKKKRGKTQVKNGVQYREKYEEVSVISSNVGSSNVRNTVSTVSKSVKTGAAISKAFDNFGSIEKKILLQLEKENIHEITSVTNLTYVNGGLQTPLGPLTYDTLDKAKDVLTTLSNELVSTNSINNHIRNLNSQYFSLIPRGFGNKIQDSDLVVTGIDLNNEFDLIKQMETAITVSDSNSDKKMDLTFHIEIAPKSVFKSIRDEIERTRKHTNLSRYKVKQVYQVENFKERKKYESYADKLLINSKKSHKLDYKEVDLFHGSRNSNVLSILVNGFNVPPASAGHVTGRMFGNGVYGADSSTKALNYSAGYWGGRSNKFNNTFIFVTRFALGKVFETTRAKKDGVPKGYDSIFAKGGADLKNNEYIVPKTEQTTITYLVEFE